MKKFIVSENGEQNKKVIFLLAGWQNKLWMYRPFAKLLSIRGFYCITYVYSADVLSPNVGETIRHFTEICKDILHRIKQLKKAGYKNFSVFGSSLGSTLALMVADRSPDVSKIILNTTGIDLAQTIWSWDHIQIGFKDQLRAQGYTLKKLQSAWKAISPAHNMDHLQGKRLLIYLAKNDEIIPYPIGHKLVEEIRRRGCASQVVINTHFRHVLTGAYNLFNTSVYMHFLLQD